VTEQKDQLLTLFFTRRIHNLNIEVTKDKNEYPVWGISLNGFTRNSCTDKARHNNINTKRKNLAGTWNFSVISCFLLGPRKMFLLTKTKKKIKNILDSKETRLLNCFDQSIMDPRRKYSSHYF